MSPIDLKELFAEYDEMRALKLERLKQSVEMNRYDICPTLVAQGIVREIILNMIALKSL